MEVLVSVGIDGGGGCDGSNGDDDSVDGWRWLCW